MKVWDGLIGCAHFEPHNGLWSHGEGAKVAIDFRLHGTMAVADKYIDVDQEPLSFPQRTGEAHRAPTS